MIQFYIWGVTFVAKYISFIYLHEMYWFELYLGHIFTSQAENPQQKDNTTQLIVYNWV